MNHPISRRSVLLGGTAVALAALAQQPRIAALEPTAPAAPADAGQRADLAERAVVERYVRPLWGQSHKQLGSMGWPATIWDLLFLQWNYWWQAHLLDCAVDAAARARTPERIDRVMAVARGIHTRNFSWTNRYYDDMAWLILAVERAERLLGIQLGTAVGDLKSALIGGISPVVGALPWRHGDNFFNTPAIGPTGIALTRLGDLSRGGQLADFLRTRLCDEDSGLTLDGVYEPGGQLNRTTHTYCQGVTIGLETELATRTGRSGHQSRVSALVAATEDRLTESGVIVGAAADDSGLFMGILARYLAEAAVSLGDSIAANIVHASAQAAWAHRGEVDGLPLFGTDWTRPVVADPRTLLPHTASSAGPPNLSRDLSVQLSGWMLFEADYRLRAAGL